MVKLYKLRNKKMIKSQWKFFLTDTKSFKSGDTLCEIVNESLELLYPLRLILKDYELVGSYDSFDTFDEEIKDQYPEEFI